jgi:hypothetical protein
MQTNARVVVAVVLALLAGCGDNNVPAVDEPVDPSAAAGFRGYAAIQDDLYAKFLTEGSSFELHRYLGDSGEELSRLVGRPDGFGVSYDVRNAKPNAMNVLVWRMMLSGFANDLVATCPGSRHVPLVDPPIALTQHAAQIASALCAWPDVNDRALGEAWDLVVGYLAPKTSREAFVRFARTLADQRADDALPTIWLGAFLHPTFLLEQ